MQENKERWIHKGGVKWFEPDEYYQATVKYKQVTKRKTFNTRLDPDAEKKAYEQVKIYRKMMNAPNTIGTVRKCQRDAAWDVVIRPDGFHYQKRFKMKDFPDKTIEEVYEIAREHWERVCIENNLSVKIENAPTKELAQYVSGFFDGDGHVSFVANHSQEKNRVSNRIGFTQTNRDRENNNPPEVLLTIANIYKGHSSIQYRNQGITENNIMGRLCQVKPLFDLLYHGIYAIGILEDLVKYSISKAVECKIMLKYCMKSIERETTVEYMHELIKEKQIAIDNRMTQDLSYHNISFPYLAGLIDADGSISIAHRNNHSGTISYSVYVIIAQPSCPPLVQLIESKYGGSFSNPQSHWSSSNMEVAKTILEGIFPYLIVKKEQCKLALDFFQYSTTRGVKQSDVNREIQRQMYEKMKELNR